MSYTENAFRSINFLKEEQIPSTPSSDELWAVEVAGSSNSLFDFKWSDHELDDMSWLRSDTFSWQSGDVYTQAYEHLAADIDGKTLQSETIGSTTVQFYLSNDGHKICPANQETNVNTIYTNTGVSWYYIIDTTNQKFKLPRTKWGFTGLRDAAGNYVPESLPNIKGRYEPKNGMGTNDESARITGAFFRDTTYTGAYMSSGGSGWASLGFDASRSSSAYQDNAPVQQKATQMYLYFYVGQFTKSAIEQTAGITSEQLNQKVDVSDLVEGHIVIESYKNGSSWYRIYSDGWVEQGGQTATTSFGTAITVNLHKQFADDTYYTNYKGAIVSSDDAWYESDIYNVTTTSFSIRNRRYTGSGTDTLYYRWYACGQGA